MKAIRYIALAITMCTCMGLMAKGVKAPKWFKKARRAQVTVLAYDAKGTMQQAQGYFIDEAGTVVTQYDFLRNATRATIVCMDGQEYQVGHLLAASSLYNIVKLQAIDAHKIEWLPLSTSPATADQRVWVMPVTTDRDGVCTPDSILRTDTFNVQYTSYRLTTAVDERQNGCPVMNEAGELMGVLQSYQGSTDVIGAQFALDMKVNLLDMNNIDYKNIGITAALPESEEQASTFLYLLGNKDVDVYLRYLDEFIATYPHSSIGYNLKAEQLSLMGQYQQADDIYRQALSQVDSRKDEVHHSMAKTIYNLNLKPDYQKYADWDTERALREVETANSINQLSLYGLLQGQCLYSLRRYADAQKVFLQLCGTNMRSPELFLYAAQCQEMMDGDTARVLAFQDSALACMGRPYRVEAAPYLLLHANTLRNMKRYREAVADYNDYERLMLRNLTANFYYEREQMEMQCRMYQQALNDIERAVRMEPQNTLLVLEQGVVLYRVGEIDEAITACRRAIELDEAFPDAHRILGICLREKGQKAEARKHLQRAVELNDPLAQDILDKTK